MNPTCLAPVYRSQRLSFFREASSQLMHRTCVNAIAFSRIHYHLFYRAHARWPDSILSCRRNIAIWLGGGRASRPTADNKAEFRRIHSAGYERGTCLPGGSIPPPFISVAVINSAECCYFRTPGPKTTADCCARKYNFHPGDMGHRPIAFRNTLPFFPPGNRIGA